MPEKDLSIADMVHNAQGFDKYGVWRVDALAAPNLKAALKLKVSTHVLEARHMLSLTCQGNC